MKHPLKHPLKRPLKQHEQQCFIEIDNSGYVRRNILTSSKKIINALRSYERFKGIRAAKLACILELKALVDDIIRLNKKLRLLLPKIPEKGPVKSIEDKQKGKKTEKLDKSGKSDEPVTAKKTKIDLLEHELSKIEKELGALE